MPEDIFRNLPLEPYSAPFEILGNVSNNAISFEERSKFHTPTLHIAALKEGWGLEESDYTAFEEVDDGLQSCRGLKNFLRLYHPITGAPITVFDNHNHALYFWLEALQQEHISMNVPLVHVDQHKDMRDPGVPLPAEALTDPQAAFLYTNSVVNVGNFIVPALKIGLLSEVIMLDSDTAFEAFEASPLKDQNFLLDIDIDVFAADLDYMDRPRMRRVIADLMARASCVTVATSPYFISFQDAAQWINTIFQDAHLLPLEN